MTNAPMIDLRDAAKKYDDGPPALAGVTLSVASGECVAISRSKTNIASS